MAETVISRIQTVIAHYSLTVSAFADQIGVQRSSVSHVLSGRNKPSLDFVMKLVKTFPEVNLYWLLNGKGSFPTDVKSESPTPSLEISDVFSDSKLPLKSGKVGPDGAAEPVKIIILYTDGTFESYDTKNR